MSEKAGAERTYTLLVDVDGRAEDSWEEQKGGKDGRSGGVHDWVGW